ncbi:MAG: Putative transmembrane protein, partial [uncultured Rubellimicrobium sp.]
AAQGDVGGCGAPGARGLRDGAAGPAAGGRGRPAAAHALSHHARDGGRDRLPHGRIGEHAAAGRGRGPRDARPPADRRGGHAQPRHGGAEPALAFRLGRVVGGGSAQPRGLSGPARGRGDLRDLRDGAADAGRLDAGPAHAAGDPRPHGLAAGAGVVPGAERQDLVDDGAGRL